ncbi:hypothetical protein B0H19DRAFT_1268131 [Mycena capillaripes]|nr:hypothetical protein B0H19DRAFT_1268131 [Mycena capillaripes]
MRSILSTSPAHKSYTLIVAQVLYLHRRQRGITRHSAFRTSGYPLAVHSLPSPELTALLPHITVPALRYVHLNTTTIDPTVLAEFLLRHPSIVSFGYEPPNTHPNPPLLNPPIAHPRLNHIRVADQRGSFRYTCASPSLAVAPHRIMFRGLASHDPVDLRFFPHSSPHSHWPLRDYLSQLKYRWRQSLPTGLTHPPPGHSLTPNKTVDIFTESSGPTFFLYLLYTVRILCAGTSFSVVMFRPQERAQFAISSLGLMWTTQLPELNCVLGLAHEPRWLFADIANPTGMNGQALLDLRMREQRRGALR